MSSSTVRHPIAVVSLSGVFCLLTICLAPGAETPAPQPQPEADPFDQFDLASMLASRGPLTRLASVPNMFGDVFDIAGYNGEFFPDVQDSPGGNGNEQQSASLDIPPAGAHRRMKIADNNKALPVDRIYFLYHHFQNALVVSPPDRTFSVDRYSIGLEKTFSDGLWSAEFRMPFGGGYNLATPGFGVEGANVGNLAITLKRLLYRSRYTAAAGGLGIDVPTGGDVTGQAGVSNYTLFNDAVHLSPWVGCLHAPNDRFFYQAFLQVDVATNGNRVTFGDNRLGTIGDQTLMFLDLEMGRWLYRNPRARCLNGLAAILELHYATTLQNTELVGGTDGQGYLQFSNTDNRVDVLNLTVGLHAQMGRTTLTVGGVLPLREDSNRTFDAEIQVFINRLF